MNFLNFFKRKTEEEVISYGYGVAFRQALSMPSKMPEGIEFYYKKNAGKIMGGSTIRISGNFSHYSSHFSSYNSGYSFTTTQKELENLYKVFLDNNFHKIEHDGVTLSDIPGDVLSIQWRDQCIEIGRGMHGQIKDEHLQAYYNCLGAIELLAEKDYTRHLKKVTIQMDETIRKEFKFIILAEDSLYRKLFENNSTENPAFSLLIGLHGLNIEIESPYREKLHVTVPVIENHTIVLNLFISNGKMKWETIISR